MKNFNVTYLVSGETYPYFTFDFLTKKSEHLKYPVPSKGDVLVYVNRLDEKAEYISDNENWVGTELPKLLINEYVILKDIPNVRFEVCDGDDNDLLDGFSETQILETISCLIYMGENDLIDVPEFFMSLMKKIVEDAK